MATYYTCPRCQQRGVVRLSPGQLCAICESEQKWVELSQKPILINNEELTAPPNETNLGGSPSFSSILPPLTGLVLGICAAILLVLFFSPGGDDPPRVFLKILSTFVKLAIILGILDILINLIGFSVIKSTIDFRRWSIKAAYIVSFLLAGIITVTAFASWLIIPPTPVPILEELPPTQRQLFGSTVTIITKPPHGTFRNSIIDTGVVVNVAPGLSCLVTFWRDEWLNPNSEISDPDGKGGNAWIQLPDGQEENYKVAHFGGPTPLLGIIKLNGSLKNGVDISPSAEAVVIGEEVESVPNPLSNSWRDLNIMRSEWVTNKGIVVKRGKFNRNEQIFTVLYTTLVFHRSDRGSGVFDTNGKLIGLIYDYDEDSQTTRVFTLSADMLAQVR